MHRLRIDPRPNWKKLVESHGLYFHTTAGEIYWDESACYQLSRFEVDTLEAATEQLRDMCLELVQHVIDNRLFGLFLIPPEFEEIVIRSWEQDDPSIYGRFDFAYNGVDPPKLLEYNADTPTALVEASVAQWHWLKDVNERGDQFNSIHERLIEAWQALRQRDSRPVHFATLSDMVEDYITTEYLRDTAIQAGLSTKFIDVGQIQWNGRQFIDHEGQPIQQLFKLYPWEWLIREQFGREILRVPQMRWIEPPWKMILSCKAILPLLYEMFPNSPFLLEASFQELSGSYVRKPIHGREGSNIRVVVDGSERMRTDGPYGDTPVVYQRLAPIKGFDGRFPIFGSWVINGVACGVGIREDGSMITQNTSRFVPHEMTD